MNRVVENLTPSEQEAERLLRAYYDREVPKPWPAFVPPGRAELYRPTVPARRSGTGSRLALALAVALMLACGWFLSGGSEQGPKRSMVVGDPIKDTGKATLPEMPMPMPDDQ